MKPCDKCGSTEQYDSGDCKPCARARARKWRANNLELAKENDRRKQKARPEINRAATARYRERHRTEILARNRAKHAANREKRNAKNAEWKKAHPDRVKAMSAKRYAAAPEKILAQTIKRRATKIEATPKWFGEWDTFVVREAAALCRMREKSTGVKWHVDHIVPLRSKVVCGLHIGNNIQVLPAKINQAKGNRYWPDMPD